MPKADIKDWKHVDTDPVDSPDSSPVRGGRGGVLGKGKAARVAVGRSSNPLKRVHGEVGDGGAPRAKRFKDGNGKLFFWTCVCNFLVSFLSTQPPPDRGYIANVAVYRSVTAATTGGWARCSAWMAATTHIAITARCLTRTTAPKSRSPRFRLKVRSRWMG
jgi:hypothetical protein